MGFKEGTTLLGDETKSFTWDEMKSTEKDFYQKCPEFYEVVKREALKFEAPLNDMWLEQAFIDDEEILVVYYPYEGDWNFQVSWDCKKNCLVDSFYEDNGNDLWE